LGRDALLQGVWQGQGQGRAFLCETGAVSNARMREQELLGSLYRTYGGRVYSRCLYLLKNKEEAQDAVQEVFIKVGNNLDGFRNEASPLTWMTRIATNHCLNVIRAKRAPWHEKYRQEVGTGVQSADGGFHFTENRELLRLCLAKVAGVDASLAELATYAFVDDMKQQDICALVGMSAPTLRKRLREFIALCRSEIEQHVPGVRFADQRGEEAPI
jgi:RNA polymerase sigma-70 factor (ECF subfamily)